MAVTSLPAQATDMGSSNRKLSYHGRLFLWLVAYSCLLGGCLVAFQYYREKQYKADELNSMLQLVNSQILKRLDEGCVDDYIAEFPVPDLRVSIIDNSGSIVYDNLLDSLPDTDHRKRVEIASAIANGEGYSVSRMSATTGTLYFYSAKKGKNYIVRTAVPYSVSLQELLTADMTFLWVMFPVLAIMCIAGFFATRRVGQHIRRLNDFARKAENGERIYGETPFPHDELGDISSHIIRLYARLQDAIAERDREHSAVLREEQEKIRIKRQLTNNINHELKTPVASMQVCLETLLTHEDMSADKRSDFLGRCYSQCVRLRRLLDEVSLITRMDEGGRMITKEDIDLAKIIAEVVADMDAVVIEHGFEIDNQVLGSLPMRGNSMLLSSVFYNLIDNAIAYSGGSRIEIRVRSVSDKSLTVEFADNGKGIPAEHMSRIFERFYRVDKGRSRRLGGTGLGLSIVKNVVVFHGGTIAASNRHAGGLRFEITLCRS